MECLDAHGAASPEPLGPARSEEVDTPQKMNALLHAAGFSEARAWLEDLVCVIDAEHLFRLKTSVGSSKWRFDSLRPDTRRSCIAEARRRMEALREGEFVARGSVVYAVACR
jgi:hypothetical protein